MDAGDLQFNPMRIRSSIAAAAPSSNRKWYILAAVGSVVLVGLTVGLVVGLGGDEETQHGTGNGTCFFHDECLATEACCGKDCYDYGTHWCLNRTVLAIKAPKANCTGNYTVSAEDWEDAASGVAPTSEDEYPWVWANCGPGMGCCGNRCYHETTEVCGDEGNITPKSVDGATCGGTEDCVGREMDCCGGACFRKRRSSPVYCDNANALIDKLPTGEKCTEDDLCLSRTCCDKTCQNASTWCEGDFPLPKMEKGGNCSDVRLGGDECLSDKCCGSNCLSPFFQRADRCVTEASPNIDGGDNCTDDYQCGTGSCDRDGDDGTCIKEVPAELLLGKGGICTSRDECVSAVCDHGGCLQDSLQFSECWADGDEGELVEWLSGEVESNDASTKALDCACNPGGADSMNKQLYLLGFPARVQQCN